METSRNHQQQHRLGLNKMSKNIKKTSNHESSSSSSSSSTSQVYNISKSEFRSVVQRLTGCCSSNDQEQARRLQRLRPPPLTPLQQPPASVSVQVQANQPSPMTEYVRFLESSLLSVREKKNVHSSNSTQTVLQSSSSSSPLVFPSPWPVLSPGFGLSPVVPSMSPNWRNML